MDYTKKPIIFKIKKTLRYVRQYGLRRTFMKVKGQYHMQKKYDCLPDLTNNRNTNGKIGLIGCGNFGYSNIAYYINQKNKNIMRGCMDKDISRAASTYEQFNFEYYTNNASKIIEDPEIKLVYIASNHASHTEYAIDCIKAGKHIHIEKPHVVTSDQLNRLIKVMQTYPNVNVHLGFNRPRSRLFCTLKKFLDEQSGPLMINWFIAGHAIPDDHWYFDCKEGGRVLGNLCHWTDLTLHLVGLESAFPCYIVPATPENAKSDFVVSIKFADRSCASITFSAKGHTFEGVREVLNLHKGDVLANLTDFHKLSLDVVEKRHVYSSFYRDHGHKANIMNSYKSIDEDSSGECIEYVRATALFFLAIKDAIDQDKCIELSL